MRYVVVKGKDSDSFVHIWTKSQHPVPVKLGITRECSHRDYLRQNNIPFTDVSSIGMIYYDPATGKREVSPLPWDTPAPEKDTALILEELSSFLKKYPDLKDEIQADWNEYQAWIRRSREFSAGRK